MHLELDTIGIWCDDCKGFHNLTELKADAGKSFIAYSCPEPNAADIPNILVMQRIGAKFP